MNTLMSMSSSEVELRRGSNPLPLRQGQRVSLHFLRVFFASITTSMAPMSSSESFSTKLNSMSTRSSTSQPDPYDSFLQCTSLKCSRRLKQHLKSAGSGTYAVDGLVDEIIALLVALGSSFHPFRRNALDGAVSATAKSPCDVFGRKAAIFTNWSSGRWTSFWTSLERVLLLLMVEVSNSMLLATILDNPVHYHRRSTIKIIPLFRSRVMFHDDCREVQ